MDKIKVYSEKDIKALFLDNILSSRISTGDTSNLGFNEKMQPTGQNISTKTEEGELGKEGLITDIATRKNMMYYDEDVNIYLAGLMNSLVRPEKMENIRRYITEEPIDCMIDRVSDESRRVRYEFFISNGEYVMIKLGFFDCPYQDRPGRMRKELGHEFNKIEMETKGSKLYALASSSLKKLGGRKARVDVLEKIAYHGVGRYARILREAFAKKEE